MPDRYLSHLPVVKAPDAIWDSIEASLATPTARPTRQWNPWIWIPAVALLLIVLSLPFTPWRKTRWQVVRTTGSQPAHAETISAGEWIQTDASTRAEMRVGAIGTVEIGPGTRLRIIATKPNENRLSLEHGEIAAKISAPPRLFFVETKSATAVDLGCEYKMKVDDSGNGLLTVSRGWVALDWQGRESLVPVGASCRVHAGSGPGTPFFADASDNFRAALDDFDFSGGGEAALRTILDNARIHDTLTLWHLLSRVEERLRPLVYDRMVAFAAPPAGVTREKVLALDPQTLKIWKDELTWNW